MTSPLALEGAIEFLRQFVKYSEVKNQKHIDLSLCVAEDRFRGHEALMVTRMAVESGTVTEDELKEKLGLN